MKSKVDHSLHLPEFEKAPIPRMVLDASIVEQHLIILLAPKGKPMFFDPVRQRFVITMTQ